MRGDDFPSGRRNTIPATRMDPNSGKLLSIFPLPNTTDITRQLLHRRDRKTCR